MMNYNQDPSSIIQVGKANIPSFLKEEDASIDKSTVESFGKEWEKFSVFKDEDVEYIGDQYFDIVNEKMLNKGTIALDVGCGSGRWTKYLANKVKFIEAIDPSKSILFATKLLSNYKNVRTTQASVENIPFENNSFDFVFSLGVLHHIPGTKKAMKKCVEKLKPGGFFLVYLYYSLDNRGILYKSLFKVSNIFRRVISSMPHKMKAFVCDLISVFVYMPFVLLARAMKRVFKGNLYKKIPLSYYVDKSFFIIRNDALDRFGTPLEQRFSKREIEDMMKECGLTDIVFSNNEPYWHAVGKKE